MSNARKIADIVNTGTGTIFEGDNSDLALTYTVVPSDHGRFLRATTDITLNLDPAASLGNGFLIHLQADGGNITVDPDGAEIIDGGATITVADGSGATVYCDGTSFYTNLSLSLSTIPGRIVQTGSGNDSNAYAIGTTLVPRGVAISINPVSENSILFFVSSSSGWAEDTNHNSARARQVLQYYDGTAWQYPADYPYTDTVGSYGSITSVRVRHNACLNCILTQSERRSDNGNWNLIRSALETSGDDSRIADFSWYWMEIEV